MPIEIPWMRRVPAPQDVAAHHVKHSVRWGPGGALWLLGREAITDVPPSVVYLYVEDDEVRVFQRGASHPIGKIDFTGCSFLPITPAFLPAFLFDVDVPVDPTGAPIRHVPTAQALAALAAHVRITGGYGAGSTDDLRSVIRERDHHASRVGELLTDATWLRLRARAFATFLSSVFECLACGWTGSPWGAPMDPRGLLRCPRCEIPSLVDPHRELPSWMMVTLLEEIMMAAEATAWRSAGRAAEAMTRLCGAGTLDGERARRGAWRGALAAGDVERAAALREHYLAEPDLLQRLAVELRANAPVPLKREGTTWGCCGTEVCICGHGWPVPLDIQTLAAGPVGTVQIVTPSARVHLRDGESLELVMHQGMPAPLSAIGELLRDALADVPEDLAGEDLGADGIPARLSRMLAICDLPNTSLVELAAEAQALRQLVSWYPSLVGRLWEVERAISTLQRRDAP